MAKNAFMVALNSHKRTCVSRKGEEGGSPAAVPHASAAAFASAKDPALSCIASQGRGSG